MPPADIERKPVSAWAHDIAPLLRTTISEEPRRPTTPPRASNALPPPSAAPDSSRNGPRKEEEHCYSWCVGLLRPSSLGLLTQGPGGGIIGCTTAYFLTRHKSFDPALHTITVLEAASVAAGASGKAGGLLALWAYPDCLVPLSFRLHAELAAQHGGAERWGYRRVKCGSLAFNVSSKKVARFEREKAAAKGDVVGADGKAWEKLPKQDADAAALLEEAGLPADLDWVDPETVEGYAEMGGPGTSDTAQVHPLHFTTSMAQLAREGGVDIRERARVTEIRTRKDKSAVEGVGYVDRETGEAKSIDDVTDVIVCAGPWTGKVLPRSKVEGLRAHSVVFEADVSPYAVFTDISLPSDYVPAHRAQKGQKRRHRGSVDPEIYARPFNEVYACGMLPCYFPHTCGRDDQGIDLTVCR